MDLFYSSIEGGGALTVAQATTVTEAQAARNGPFDFSLGGEKTAAFYLSHAGSYNLETFGWTENPNEWQ
jgi:hypothetical protein